MGLVSGSGTKHVHAQQTSTRTAKAHLDWDVLRGPWRGWHRCSERDSVSMVAGRDEPRPCPSMAALIERPVPVRVRVGTSENVTDRWLGERVAEFEARLQPLTLRRCEEVVVHGTPTGESNPAATSMSWWQGPPLGHAECGRMQRDHQCIEAWHVGPRQLHRGRWTNRGAAHRCGWMRRISPGI